jgi:hypothetical protein
MKRELKIGDRIKDNDPRMGDRVLVITDVSEDFVTAVTGPWVSRIQRKRIFTDGKPRRTGFSLVDAA